MILGFLIGLVVGAFFGAWLYWTLEVREPRGPGYVSGTDDTLFAEWINKPYDRLHGRRDRL